MANEEATTGVNPRWEQQKREEFEKRLEAQQKREEFETRLEALRIAANRPRHSGGMVISPPKVESIVGEAEAFYQFLTGGSA